MGSLVPDFEKFMRMKAYDDYSHTWESIFYFNLPVAIIFSFIFHLVVRNVLIDNLPHFLAQRLSRFKKLNWIMHFKKHYPIIISSILIGVLSHLVWDSFTHVDGKLVKWYPFLSIMVYWERFGMSIYNILQYSTSGLGVLVIGYAVLSLPPERITKPNKNKIYYWLTFVITALIIFGLRMVAGLDLSRLLDCIVSAISALLLSLIITSFVAKRGTV